MSLHPKYKRYFRQALGFALVWFIFGIIYCLLELGIMGRESIYPSTGNRYDFKNSLFFVGVGSFVLGGFQGWIEVVWFRKHFARRPLWSKLLLKGIYYLVFLIVFLSTIAIAINSYYLNLSPFDLRILETYFKFIGRFPFWSVIIYTAAILAVALLLSEVNQYLGAGMLRNFFLGKYHRPKKEIRIFMFLDMKSSTTIAESLGHERYFELLRLYYSDMSDAILETCGEIYQYVGDEIVVSWPKNSGVRANNCIRCFELISESISKNKEAFLSKYGVFPEFKAGCHIGEVTTGEIGDIKKDLIYTGDVLNTTARIQAKCNNYDAKLLLSGALIAELPENDSHTFVEIGQLLLRGKQEPIRLFKCKF
nr:adenylate/guanylate cyclase domain-containing protein [uncultured Allomuricauda sp.]